MLYCYFFRVFNGISREDILNQTIQNKNYELKRIPFVVLKEIILNPLQFEEVCSDLSIANDCYQKYVRESVADEHGIWRCIYLKNSVNKENITLFTAGLPTPLYAAIDDDNIFLLEKSTCN